MLRLGSNFTGIGAWEKGLTNKKIEYDLKFFSEIDKYAIESYSAIHSENQDKNIGDITEVKGDEVEDIDVFVYSPPCQAFSVAGKQLGVEDTRGVLFFDSLRIIDKKRPYICMMENVKGLTTKKFTETFGSMLSCLEELGYRNYWKVLNLKDYGLPQNRERIFIISIRNDIDDGKYEFPKGFDNGLRLKDMLEDEVDEKYYISQDKVEKLMVQLKSKDIITGRYNQINGFKENEVACTIDASVYKGLGCNQDRNAVAVPCLTPDRLEKRQNGRRFKEDGESMFTFTGQDRHGVLCIDNKNCFGNPKIFNNKSCNILASHYKEPPMVLQIGNIAEEKSFKNPQTGRIYSNEGISPTLNTCGGGQREPKVFLIDDTKSEAFGGGKVWEDIAPCLRSSRFGHKILNTLNYRIRKLTPKECWRLQGFTDEDFEKARQALNDKFYKGRDKSSSQLYKQAGNSIGVTLLEELYETLMPYFEKIIHIK